MIPFRSEIINSPTRYTIKIYLADESLDANIKDYLYEYFDEIDFIEIQDTVEQNRDNENITVYLKGNADINIVQEAIDSSLRSFFEQNSVGD